MKKSYILILLAIVTIAGSLFTALSSNMLFDDIFNVGVGIANMTMVASLPAVSFTIIFLLLVLYLIRTYRHPDCVKRITRTYLIIQAAFSLVGIVGAILAGALVYHTFVGNHPFPGYILIFMILNLLVLVACCYGYFYVRKWKDDEGRVKINFKYVMKTIGWVLFIGLVFNRLGMFLGAPSYIYLRNLHLTFPVYLYLLLPIFLGLIKVLQIYEMVDRKKIFILTIVALGLNVIFFTYTAVMGINDTAFISSLSQLFPLERMASKPVELPIHFLAYVGVGVSLFITNKNPK